MPNLTRKAQNTSDHRKQPGTTILWKTTTGEISYINVIPFSFYVCDKSKRLQNSTLLKIRIDFRRTQEKSNQLISNWNFLYIIMVKI